MKLKIFVFVAAHMLALLCAQAQTVQTLDAKIAAIMNRPELRHALFGIEIYSLSDNRVLYRAGSVIHQIQPQHEPQVLHRHVSPGDGDRNAFRPGFLGRHQRRPYLGRSVIA